MVRVKNLILRRSASRENPHHPLVGNIQKTETTPSALLFSKYWNNNKSRNPNPSVNTQSKLIVKIMINQS